MRISSATLLLSSASLVLATPLRLIVIEKVSVPPSFVRIGHAAVNANHDYDNGASNPFADIPIPEPMTPESEVNIMPPPAFHKCEISTLSSISTKLHSVGNYFREIIGLPTLADLPVECVPPAPIKSHHHEGKPCHSPKVQDDRVFHIMPMPWMPAHPVDKDLTQSLPPPRPARLRGSNQSMWLHRHIGRPTTFASRLQKALYALSPWEGRALAFVVGCGIGVILRMFYVFAVLAIRAMRHKEEHYVEFEIEEEVVFEDPSDMETAPPVYYEKIQQ